MELYGIVICKMLIFPVLFYLVLSLRPGIGRDPYDHVSDHRDADYVLCGYARQFLRFRWSIFAGRRDDNHTMRNRDAAGCVQSAFVDCGGVITL